jgi:hypothetical protein
MRDKTDKTLADEILSIDEESQLISEMSNLDQSDTGIKGIIYVSTVEGNHGPRIKYQTNIRDKKRYVAISLEEEPQVRKNTDKSVSQNIINQCIEFARINREALINFWFNGHNMTKIEVQQLLNGLTKV